MRKIGDKEAVYYGEAEHTPGGLSKQDLMENSKGKIVSIRQHKSGLEKVKNLKDARGGSFRGFLERANPAPRGGNWWSRVHVGGYGDDSGCGDGGSLFSMLTRGDNHLKNQTW
jgi:hypothetical protein